MAANITGTVFNDVNRNGTFDAGDTGIVSVNVVLQSPGGGCQIVVTDATGSYSFTGLTTSGNYTLYETVAIPNGCPPTNFTQPSGSNSSTTQRTITLNVTQANIDNNNTLANNNFGHVSNVIFGCDQTAYQVSSVPSNMSTIDLLTGQVVNQGVLTPSATYNAIGYSVVDGTIYGYNVTTNKVISISKYTTVNQLATVPNLPSVPYNVGDVDFQGHLYLYKGAAGAAARAYIVDINPNSPTYLKLVDPANSFNEQTANFGIPISPVAEVSDWAFNPVDNQLYGIEYLTGIVISVNPVTGVNTALTTLGLPTQVAYGAVFFDSSGNLYGINNTTGQIYKVILSGNTATGSVFSQANPSFNNDGARCAFAALGGLNIVQVVDKVSCLLGATLTYTSKVTNPLSISQTNVIITSSIPAGTTFVDDSVTVDGSQVSGNPADGINVGTLPARGSSRMTFQAKVGNTLPNPNPIPNTASVKSDQSSGFTSNTVNTVVYDTSRGVMFI